MAKKRHSSTSATPEVHQGATPHSPLSIVLCLFHEPHAKKSGTGPNSSSTTTTRALPQGADPAPATQETTQITLKTASAKKPKTTHERTPAAVSVKTSFGGSRRSSRLLNVAKTTIPNEEIKRLIEDITSTDSEEEEEEMQPVAEVTQRKNYPKHPVPVPESGDTGEKSLEELVKLCEAQQKTIAELKAEIHFVIVLASLMIDYQILNNVKPSDLYKSLYIDSKKENEALTKEVHQLRMDIEFARGRAVGLGEAMMTVVVAVARTAFQGGDE
ncbi:hypothetical protein LINPERHAP1_LOCUS513 [Linum perenne]